MHSQPLTDAILIGVETGHGPLSCQESLYELADLAITAHIRVAATIIQNREAPDPKSYLGSGKIQEVAAELAQKKAHLIIADDELKPRQQKFLQNYFQVKILDRTSLILDIFAQRAQTHEAKIQVELAQLTYLSTRLTRLWTHLSRLGGGIGTRGPGEKQLEVDKRLIRSRIQQLKKKLKKVKLDRKTHRVSRKKRPHLIGAIIGYTNAGKSTLFNRLTNSHVLEEDLLFATLDPTTRQLKLAHDTTLLITDTVGFIQKLPTQLITAFQATLEEIYEADFFIHVLDATSPHLPVHIQTTTDLLHHMDKPVFYIFNKSDLIENPSIYTFANDYQPHCILSAHNGPDINRLKTELYQFMRQFEKTITVKIPYDRSDIRHLFHQHGHILNEKYTAKTMTLTVTIQPIIGQQILQKLKKLKSVN